MGGIGVLYYDLPRNVKTTKPSTIKPEPEVDDWPIIKCGEHNDRGLQNFGIFLPIAGRSTQEGEWPHMCLIFENSKVIGGASLIAPKVLVTAAHIVQ